MGGGRETAGKETRTAVALLSGGLDSVVAVADFLDRGGRVLRCLNFAYGQRAAHREREASRRFCERFGLRLHPIGLPWLEEVSSASGSALVATERDLPSGTQDDPGDEESAKAVWVPARNCVLLAVAAAYAELDGAQCVIAGFNREEAVTFPDNSPEFVAAASAMLAIGTRNGVVVEAPVGGLDKREIVARARQLGIGPEDLWSCYRGDAVPCGRCESCLRSARAWGRPGDSA